MAEHYSHLDDKYFLAINNGDKKYELRVNDETRQEIKINYRWIFSNRDYPEAEPIVTLVTERKEYPNFREGVKDTGPNKLLPGVQDEDKAVNIYESFPHELGTYKDGAEKFGVVRFRLKVLNN